jgi:hypothetical protein
VFTLSSELQLGDISDALFAWPFVSGGESNKELDQQARVDVAQLPPPPPSACVCWRLLLLRVELYKNESFLLFYHLITGRIFVRRLCGSQSPTEVTHGAYESPDCPLRFSVSKDVDTYLKIRKTTFTRQNLTVVWFSVAVSE